MTSYQDVMQALIVFDGLILVVEGAWDCLIQAKPECRQRLQCAVR